MSLKIEDLEKIVSITNKVNYGVSLEEVLNNIFDSFHSIIPYNRVGFALLEDDPHLGKVVRSHWVRADNTDNPKISKGYTEKLSGSSLEKVIVTGEIRIINDLTEYLTHHPQSRSTRLIIEDGIRSSLTCPIIAMGNRVGFLFFSSVHPNTYKNLHQTIFKQIASQVSIIVEKSRLYQKLFEANEAKRQFIGFACHDLRNPAGIIKTNLEFLQEEMLGIPTDAMKKSFLMMERAVDQMLELLDRLLDLSAIESGKIELHLSSVDLKQYLKDFNNSFEVLLQPKKLRLSISVDPALPSIVMDTSRINQILVNLVGNAIKYSFNESTIDINARRNENAVMITISNVGPSIPEELRQKIFEEFENFKKVGGRSGKSFGLGLAIARKMAEIHGGAIELRNEVDGEVGKNTSFVVTLPIAGPVIKDAELP